MKLNNGTTSTVTSFAILLGAMSAFASHELREEFHQNYPLEKQGTVSLENVNGNVQIMTWDREEVKVDAVRSAKKQEQLDEVKIEVDSKPDRIGIKTKYPDSRKHKNNYAGVAYTLTVPRQSNLARSVLLKVE
jgi:hypothetical protein